MIDFIELKDGRIFNGNPPYVFWFENGQSVNLNYVRKVCFISNYSTVYAHLDSPVFSLLKLNQNIPALNDPDIPGNQAEVINSKIYMDLANLKVTKYTSIGVKYNNFYVHMIYIMANSKDAGEIRDKFYLIDKDGRFEFEVGADFYIDNELLKNEMDNFDIRIPESIQKAIYDVDVHEESNDNITLNRKYKELLMNYWDIVANKGSYNSLQNSLAWFEWGDLVRIEELWKRHHENLGDYFLENLNRELDVEFTKQFLNNSKTTCIGLYMALYNYIRLKNGEVEYETDNGRVLGADPDFFYPSDLERMTEDDIEGEDYNRTPYSEMGIDGVCVGNYVYIRYVKQSDDTYKMEEVLDFSQPGEMVRVPSADEDMNLHTLIFQTCTRSVRPHYIYQEPNPRLTHINARWQYLDLCLKMSLLGNFYSTYFMPIHMDLIHSTVEHWVFTNAIKVLHANRIDKYEKIEFGKPFELTYDKRVKIQKHRNHAYSNTLFMATDNSSVFGYDGDIHQEIDPEGFYMTGEFTKYPYDCMAGVVHFKTIFDHQGEGAESLMLATDAIDCILMERVVWKSGDNEGSIVSHSVIYPTLYESITGFEREGFRATQYVFNFGFDLAFQDEGDYDVEFEFYTSSGNVWVSKAHVLVEDNISNHIDLYKVLMLDESTRQSMELTDPDNFKVWFNPFQMTSATDPYEDPSEQGTHLGTERSDHEYTPYKEHSMFIKPFKGGSVGFNETVIFTILPENKPVVFHMEDRDVVINFNGIGDPSNPDDTRRFLDELSSNIKEFMWLASPWPLNPNIHQKGVRIVGVCREYDKQFINSIEGLVRPDYTFDSKDNDKFQDPYVISMRFHPYMHTIELFKDTDEPIQPNELIYMEPVLGHSKDLEISNWRFRNQTTQKEFDSHLMELRYYGDGKNEGDFGNEVPGGMQSFFVTPPESVELKPGYYSIYITYKKGENVLQHDFESAFIIGK